jgi:hypothetical protein
MMRRFFRYVAMASGLIVVLVGTGVVFYILSDRAAYRSAEITSALMESGRYDPVEHFKFDRACVFPPESAFAGELTRQGYRQSDAIFPESHIHWTLVLIDETSRRFRVLYVQNPKIRFAGQIVCGPRIALRTERHGDVTTAYAINQDKQPSEK